MSSIADGTVRIQTSSQSLAAPPSWFGEVVLLSASLRQHGVLTKISEQVRFARRRFGHYEVIDFLAILFGYAIRGERTLEAFYQRLQPVAVAFMALFEREQLPARSTLSRFLAALTQEPVEALRTLFLADLLARPLTPDKQTGGLVDRKGDTWMIFDMDGTRQAARQRALPQTDELPPPFRRLDDVCAPGYRGRKRGEVVRTRTTSAQTHSYQWLGSFGNRGNGHYREELRKGLSAIRRYLTASQLDPSRTLLRLDGHYGTGAALSDVAEFAFVTRGKEYSVLDHPLVQARLHLPPDQSQQRPESQLVRSLYDCPQIPVGPDGAACRVIVATHPAGKKKSPVGVTRTGVVYELFFTKLPQHAFTACDVVELYLHRGAFEPQRIATKIRRSTRIGGAATPPGGKRHGVSSANGSGICAWNWDINFNLTRCARPNLPPPSHRRTSSRPAPRPHPLPPRDMGHLLPPPPGKRAGSAEPTFLSSLMGHCAVPPGSRFTSRSDVARLMAVCAWCMPPAFATAAPVRCVSNVNGMAARPQSHARSACCCIRFASVSPHYSGAIGGAETTGAPVCSSPDSSASRSACRHPPSLRRPPPM